MDTSGYDLKAWQAYYENQGYDMATSSTYAAYAMQQAAAAAYAPAASSSSSTAAAYGYPTQAGYTPAPAGWDSDPNQQLPYGSVAGAPGQPEPTEGASKFTGKRTTVIRKGGGKMWDDPTLTEWDPKWFRLFVSDVSNDCTEKVLIEAFSKYPTFQKAKVIKDKLSNKSKYAFLAFSDPEDFLLAWKQMDGKYVGNRPIRLSKATTNVRSVEIGNRKAKMFDKAGRAGIGLGERGRVL